MPPAEERRKGGESASSLSLTLFLSFSGCLCCLCLSFRFRNQDAPSDCDRTLFGGEGNTQQHCLHALQNTLLVYGKDGAVDRSCLCSSTCIVPFLHGLVWQAPAEKEGCLANPVSLSKRRHSRKEATLWRSSAGHLKAISPYVYGVLRYCRDCTP